MDSGLDLHYERLLGEGSYGKVFLVKQEDGQQFAVKEIDLTKCDEDGRDQAQAEANLLSRIKQENILLYVESVVCDECLYIVTEFCGGGDLEDYLQVVAKRKASIPESLVSEWILQLGGALKYLHDQKILHRDMKTKNVFLKEDLTVKLGDLGIAKVLDLNQSKADTFVGTPSYMSPELFSGKSYNHKTDIWGLGCCVYEMMTLKRAFQGKALWTLIREIKNGRVLELPDEYSLELRTLVQELMSQKPEDRPSAKDIMQNDLLTYHMGAAHDEVVKSLPHPQEQLDKKQRSRGSRAIGGSGSGSLRQVLLQMNQSQEEKFKNTIESVCGKLNTLRMSQKGTVDEEDFNTFVYKGDSDSEEELEAAGTILDKSLLKQYTEKLDTFVFKGEGILDSDSDYSTGGSVKNKGPKDHAEDEEDDVSRTLIKQYSQTLEEDEEGGRDSEGEGAGHNEGEGAGHNEGEDSGWGHSDSPEPHDNFDQTLQQTFVSKYQYKGLKDTLALRPDKKWSRDSRDVFSPNRVVEDKTSKKNIKRSENDTVRKSPQKSKGISLSASMSSTDSLNFSKDKVSDPRLNRTLSLEKTSSKQKVVRIRTCDRIEQSSKVNAGKQKSPKKAFIDTGSDRDKDSQAVEEADVSVPEVISHLRGNITPYTSVDSQSETIGPANRDGVLEDQDLSPGKGKKKKANYLKKQSEAKKQSQDSAVLQENGSNDQNVKLFTRAQSARFTKSESIEEEDADVIPCLTGMHSVQDIINCIQNGCSESVRNEQILVVQHELTAGVGYDNLRKVLDIMGMVSDRQEMQMHILHILGPKLYEEYKLHLEVVRLLEGQSSSIT